MSWVQSLRRQGYGRTLVAAVIVIVYLFPVYWMVASSLKTQADIFQKPPQFFPTRPTLEAYRDAVINNDVILRSILNSVVIAVGVTFLTLILAPPAAYALARLRPRGSGIVLLALLISQLLPAVVVAGPLFVMFSRFDTIKLINSYQGMIIADVTATLPFAVIILRPYFLSVPRELESASMVDGSTQFGSYFRIVLPLIRPGLVTVAAFSFLIAWGEFIFALSLNLNDKLQPITVATNKFIGQYGTQWNLLMATATAVAIPIVIVFLALQRYIVGGLMTGATKE
jgi:multiple sugar transport system permease protein